VADPVAKFEHIWGALMRVLGSDHRKQYQANKLILNVIHRRQRGR
jgi:hypothetical protein